MGGKTLATASTRLEALDVQSSSAGVVIPVTYGLCRVALGLLDYRNFTAVPHTTSTGGKGGGRQTNTTYTYTADVVMTPGRGPVVSVPRVWRGKQLYAGGVTPTQVQLGGGLWTPPLVGAMTYTLPEVQAGATFMGIAALYYQGGSGDFAYQVNVTDYSVIGAVLTVFDESARGEPLALSYQYVQGAVTQTALQDLGLVLQTGTTAQAPWTALSGAGDHELGYSGLALLCGQAYDLGDSAQVENHQVEVVAPLAYHLGSEVPDVDPSLALQALLADEADAPAGIFGDWSAWSDWCVAGGLLVSPALTEQQSASDVLAAAAELTNTKPVWTGGQLRMVPYADAAVTAHGRTYTPDTTPVYLLDDDCWITPLKATRKAPTERKNHHRIEYEDRANGYAVAIAEAKDVADIDVNGLRSADIYQAHWIKDASTARFVAQLRLQQSLGVVASYKGTLPGHFALLDPADLVSVVDPALNMASPTPQRVVSVEETDDGDLDVTLEDYPPGVASAPRYATQLPDGYKANYNIAPGPAEAPVIFEAPGELTQGALELYVAATGLGGGWGGCHVWVSLDGTNYRLMGTIDGGSRYGTLSAACTASGGVAVSVLKGALLSGSAADADALNTLCFVRGAGAEEFFSFQTASLTAARQYTLGGEVVRGAYGTAAASHPSGSAFVRVDDSVAKSGPIDLGYIGRTVRIKLTSFNVFGGGEEQLSDVAEYTYAITGDRVQGGDAGGAGYALVITIYKQAEAKPAQPSGGSYTFDGDVFVAPTGWSRTLPSSSSTPTWATSWLFTTTTPAVPIPGPTYVGDQYASSVTFRLAADATHLYDAALFAPITVLGNAHVSTAAGDQLAGSAGVVAFDGSGDGLTVPHATGLDLTTGDFTIEALVRIGIGASTGVIINKGTGTGYYPYQLWYDATASRFGARGFGAAGGLAFSLSALAVATAGQYYHLRLTRSGNTFDFAVGGVSQASSSFTGSLYSDTSPLCIGSYSDGSYSLNGLVPGVRTTKGWARTDAALTSFTEGDGADVTLLLNLEGTEGSTALDDSSLLNADAVVNCNASISTAVSKWGGGSLEVTRTAWMGATWSDGSANRKYFRGVGEPWTFDCWFLSSTAGNTNGSPDIFVMQDVGNGLIRLAHYAGTGSNRLIFRNGNIDNYIDYVPGSDGWIHIEVGIGADENGAVYVQGQPALTFVAGGNSYANIPGSFTLGHPSYANAGPTVGYPGVAYLQDARITRRRRHTSAFAPPTSKATVGVTGGWPVPVKFVVDGEAGSGFYAQVISIFKQQAAQPAAPTGGSYTFAGDVFVSPTGWTRGLPDSSETPTWVSSFLFETDTPTVPEAVPTGGWSTPIKFVQDGISGVSMTLTSDRVTVAASSDGTVPSGGFASALTHAYVTIGNADDTNNWTFSKVDSSGITSTISGAVVAVSAMSGDDETVTITGTKAGYSAQTKTFHVLKSRAASSGGSGGSSSGVANPTPVAHETVMFGSGVPAGATLKAGFRFETDGTCSHIGPYGTYEATGTNWYAPTTSGIGSTPGYWIRVSSPMWSYTSSPGSSVLGDNFGTWLPLSTARRWEAEITSQGPGNTSAHIFIYCAVAIATDSAGANVVASGTLYLEADEP